MNKKIAAKAALVFFMLFISINPAIAEAVGRFTAIEGRVDVLRPGEKRASPVALGAAVSEGDIVRTKSDSFAEITFSDDTVLKLTQSTRVEIKEYLLSGNKRQSGALKLLRGKVRATVSKGLGRVIPVIYSGPSTFKIETPTAVAGVKGTDFFVFYDMGTTGVFVLEGAVDTMGLDESHNVVRVRGGEYTIVEQNGPAAAAAAAREFAISKHMRDADPEAVKERRAERERDRPERTYEEREGRVIKAASESRSGDEGRQEDRWGREHREHDRDDRRLASVSGREDSAASTYYAQAYYSGREPDDFESPILEINMGLFGSYEGVLATAPADILQVDADIEGSFRDDYTWWGEVDGDYTNGGADTTFTGTMSGTFQNGSFTGTLSNGIWDNNGTWSADVTGTIPGGTFTGTLSGDHDGTAAGEFEGNGQGTWTPN